MGFSNKKLMIIYYFPTENIPHRATHCAMLNMLKNEARFPTFQKTQHCKIS